ncbi:MAG: extracellular solute-binding protein [bacterium]|nr:extracellular solute-binding protein [bacterium]
MKKLVVFVTVFLLIFSFGGYGVQAASNELTVYTPAQKDVINLIIPMAEKELDATVYVVEAGTGQLFQRIAAESANPQADIMLTGGIDSGGSFRAYLDDYVSKEDDNLIVSAKEHPWYNALYLNPMGIVYNTELVKEGEVKGWMDLTDPKWKDKVLMPDPRKSGSAFGELIIFLHVFGREGPAWDFVKQLHANLVIVTSSAQTHSFVAAGEYPLGLTHERNAYKYSLAGGPVGFVYPEEGTAVRPDGLYLVKGGPNPELAKKFIDFMLSKKAMEAMRDLGYRINRKDVEPPEGYAPVSSIKQSAYDPVWAAENRETILQQWTEIEESK